MLLSESYKARIKKLAGILTEAKMEDLYDDHFSDIPREDFDQIISNMPELAKDRNDYKSIRVMSNWIIDLYRKGRFPMEDLYKAKEYLTLFYENIKDIKDSEYSEELKNYKDLPSLFSVVEKYKTSHHPGLHFDENALLKNSYFIDKGEAEVVLNTARWFVVVPKTLDASKFYGHDSQWCTLYPDMFNKYSSEGPLYILIDKEKVGEGDPNRRLQFHFESSQYMNMYDQDVMTDSVDRGYGGWDYDYDDHPHEMDAGFFLKLFEPKLIEWYFSKKPMDPENIMHSFEIPYLSDKTFEQMVWKNIEEKGSIGHKLFRILLNDKITLLNKIIEKIISTKPEYEFMDYEMIVLPEEMKERLVNKRLKLIEEHLIEFLEKPQHFSKFYKGKSRDYFSTKAIDEDLQIKMMNGIFRILDKHVKSNGLYNRLIKRFFEYVDGSYWMHQRDVSDKVKKLINDRFKKEAPLLDASKILTKEDYIDYIKSRIKRNVENEDDLMGANFKLGSKWFNSYLKVKLSRIKKKLKSKKTAAPLLLYAVDQMNEKQQKEYLGLLYGSKTSNKIDYDLWRRLKREVRAYLYMKSSDNGKFGSTTNQEIMELIKQRKDDDEAAKADYEYEKMHKYLY